MVEEAILLKSNNEQEQEKEETNQQEFVQEKHRASCAVIIWRCAVRSECPGKQEVCRRGRSTLVKGEEGGGGTGGWSPYIYCK